MKTNLATALTSVLLVFCLVNSASAQKEILKQNIERAIKTVNGTVGVAIVGLEDRDTMTVNGNSRLPMQSVYKFPLAMAILDQVDQNKFSLNQNIHIKKEDLLPNTWSPLRDKYPDGNVDISLAELLSYTVSKSDNNGCDILFRLIGGPKKVEAYIHSLGVKEMAIATTEEQMHKAWDAQFENWCTPKAMAQLFDVFYQGKILSKLSNEFLWKILTETETGPNRIKGLLPAGTIVAHKTGSSGTNDKGLASAINDAGIVALPNGKHFAIVVFVCNTTADEATCEKVIAQVSKSAWDYFSSKKN